MEVMSLKTSIYQSYPYKMFSLGLEKFFTRENSGDLYRMMGGGNSWECVVVFGEDSVCPSICIDGGYLYYVCVEWVYGQDPIIHFYKTGDFGSTWEGISDVTVTGTLNQGTISNIESLGNGQFLFGYNGKLYKSVDYCTTWLETDMVSGTGNVFYIVNAGDGLIFIVDSPYGREVGELKIYRSVDFGANFAQVYFEDMPSNVDICYVNRSFHKLVDGSFVFVAAGIVTGKQIGRAHV